MKTSVGNQVSPRHQAFTLIELLVVISIIAVLTALTIPVIGSVFRAKKIATAQAEMQYIQSALENYKAKYGVYPPCDVTNALANQLYYELSGVTTNINNNITNYTTLDGLYTLPVDGFPKIFNTGGIINCTKGSGEDAIIAKNFLLGLKNTQITTSTNANSGTQLVPYLATSVAGPDANYHPGYGWGFAGNPFRYLYPGTNNPNGYDLWVQLSIGATASNPKMYLICNWSSQVIRNSPLP